MRRLKRVRQYAFAFFAALSLILLVTTCVLWERSHRRFHVVVVSWTNWPQPDTWRSRSISLRLVQGRWLLYLGTQEKDLRPPAQGGPRWDASEAQSFRRDKAVGGLGWSHFAADVRPPPVTHLPGGLTLRQWFGHRRLGDTDAQGWAVSDFWMGPAWLTTVVLLVLPVAWVVITVRQRARRRRGRCTSCGYDLRASPERCPECGAVPEGNA